MITAVARRLSKLSLKCAIEGRFGFANVPAEKISMVRDTYYFASPDTSPTEFIDYLKPSMVQP